MLDTVKEMIANQFDAALCTLSTCIERCPEACWDVRIANHRFDQVAFHAVFFTDYYLGPDAASFREQPFHRENAPHFAEYDELIDRPPTARYERSFVRRYVDHCRNKAAAVIASETADSLGARCGFERWDFSRGELYVTTIRHIQHHAAQLGLRLRLDAGKDLPWVASGWRRLVH